MDREDSTIPAPAPATGETPPTSNGAARTPDATDAPMTPPPKPALAAPRPAAPEGPSSRVALVIRAVIGVVALVVAAGIFARLAATKPTAPISDDPLANTPQVEALIPRVVSAPRQVRGYGVAQAVVEADIPARVAAVVDQLGEGVAEGKPVDTTTTLITLDSSDFVNQRDVADQALAAIAARKRELDAEEKSLRERQSIEDEDLRVAERELTRMRQFNQNRAGSQGDLDRAERAVLSARRVSNQTGEQIARIDGRRAALEAERLLETANRKIANDSVLRSTIKPPIAGVLQSLDVERGENVAVGARVARVVQLDRIEAPISLPASARPLVTLGDAVVLRSTADGRTWDAQINRVLPENDPQTRTFVAYAELNQTQALASGGPVLMPGAFLEATVTTAEVARRPVLPRRSIQTGQVLLLERLPVEPDVQANLPAGAELARVRVAEAVIDYHYTGPLPDYGLPGETQWAVLAEPLPASDGVIPMASTKVLDGARVVARGLAAPDEGSSGDAPDTSPPSGG